MNLSGIGEITVKMAKTLHGDEGPRVLTMEQTARLAGISKRTLRKRLSAGRFPVRPVTWSLRPKLFRRAEVERMLARGTR